MLRDTIPIFEPKCSTPTVLSFSRSAAYSTPPHARLSVRMCSKWAAPEDPMQLYINFRGRKPDANALLRNRGLIPEDNKTFL